jgi:hypothetical protein
MTTLNFGTNVGEAFAHALKNIYAGKRSKLERINGDWVVAFKSEEN